MKRLIYFILCFFLVLQGSWEFIPYETLEIFLSNNTPLPQEAIPYISDEWCNLANENDGYLYISQDTLNTMNDIFLKEINNTIDSTLENNIDNLLDNLED